MRILSPVDLPGCFDDIMTEILEVDSPTPRGCGVGVKAVDQVNAGLLPDKERMGHIGNG